MFKHLLKFEHVLEDKVCTLLCENNSSWEFIKESLAQFVEKIIILQHQAKAEEIAKAASLEQQKPVEIVEEVHEER